MHTRIAATVLSCMLAVLLAAPAMANLYEYDEEELKEEGWINLFDGEDLSGWVNPNDPEGDKNWYVDEDGFMTNVAGENNIATEKDWEDFEVRLDYRIPEGGNSGVYLRGRVEIQILDTTDEEGPRVGADGAIYNQHAPEVLAANPPGEWNSLYIKCEGDTVSATLNDEVIHDENVVTGPTGGALPGDFDEPGPIMLQNYSDSNVWFRNIWVRPVEDDNEDG
ncbi:MAG: DUF1080 domain-containing protein [Candidatus Hydrogenedentota bacterium]